MLGVSYTSKVYNQNRIALSKYIDSKEFTVLISQQGYSILLVDSNSNVKRQINTNNPYEVANQLGATIIDL
jgi:dihydroxyacetone kinase-like predicted kinase